MYKSIRDLRFMQMIRNSTWRDGLKKTLNNSRLVLVIGLMLTSFLFVGAQKDSRATTSRIQEHILDGLEWRSIGPANMGGRIDDFAVVEGNPHIIYAGTASGGVWKTTNNGITWTPIFDDQTTSTIGDVTVAPSQPDTVWVGTGEPNNRQSSSWGSGVYKSTDGGETWTNMGLEDTHHIGRIVIHPNNPDIVYVAALGHLWGPNEQRGLYKTTDGGKTWSNTKFIDQDTGFVDVAMDPKNPDTLYAAAYQRRRRGWGFNGGGPGSGLYKTTDGGDNWIKLSGGLPDGHLGRLGLDIYCRNPSIVYAVVEHKTKGGVYRSEDKGSTWTKMSGTNPRPMYYSQIRIDPNNDQRIWVLGASMYVSDDGGKSFQTNHVTRVHGDHHAMWIHPKNSNHMVLGSDGGIYFSYDRGKSWDFVNALPLGQFYEIGIDMRKPYWIYGGLQDNGSWGGPSATWFRQGITNDEWIRIGGGDGFYTQVDPEDHTLIYAESQNGNLYRVDLKTGESKSLKPQPKDSSERYRFNWNSPIFISPHDPNTLYYGGNKLFISKDKGETWEATEDLTTQQDREKLELMGVLPDEKTLSRHDGISSYGNITTISESPVKAGLLYAGTDDGNIQVSRDGGKTWTNVLSKMRGLPKYTYVTRVVASQHDESTAYATFDGHRNDDFRPYVFRTQDYGESWTNISANLPMGSVVNVIREHHKNPKLLFIGTERGAYFSIDRGGDWTMFKGNFPMVPVDDIAVHPRENDLIFGTHGRSVWVLDDITPLEQLTPQVLGNTEHLFETRPAQIFNYFNHKGNLGHKVFVAPNPPFGAQVSYYLKEGEKDVKILVKNSAGKVVREIEGKNEAGINRVSWDLRYSAPQMGNMGRMSRYFRSGGPFVLPGEYQILLQVADQEIAKPVEVTGDPRISIPFEDRKSQHDALYTIYELFPLISTASRAIDKIQKEITALKKDLEEIPEVPEVINETVKTVEDKAGNIRKKLFGDPDAGFSGMRESLRGKFLLLYRSIGDYTGAPTESQIQQIDKNSEELKALVLDLNAIIETDIPKLNKLLNENDVPRLFVGDPIKY
jgi:photosystem II stability/assembly factor-like uncharacterized protein